MERWYEKYLTIYGKPFSEVPQIIIDGTRERLAALQSDEPLASIVVIGYNEVKNGTITYRRYGSQEQVTVSIEEFINIIKKHNEELN